MAAPHSSTRLDREGWQVAFLDVLLILVVVLLPLVNPPKAEEATRPPGSLIAEIRWPDDCSSDVDLWVQGPVSKPVGYSNSSGMVFNLLRDDLGTSGDLSNLNYENAFTRGLPDGDYAINLHLYGHSGGCALPIPVDVSVHLQDKPPKQLMVVHKGRTLLSRVGEETTVIRFSLRDGGLVSDSKNTVPIALREAK